MIPIKKFILLLILSVFVITGCAKDEEAPRAPSNLSASVINDKQSDRYVLLKWKASYDNIGVTEYKISRKKGTGEYAIVASSFEDNWVFIDKDGALSAINGAVAMESLYVTYEDHNVLDITATQYCYKISAKDDEGNQSGQSQPACVTVNPPDPTSGNGGGGTGGGSAASGAPRNLDAISSKPDSISLSWMAPSGSITSPSYRVYRGGSFVAETQEPRYTASGLSSTTNYCFTVTSKSQSSAESTHSNQACATTSKSAQESESNNTFSAADSIGIGDVTQGKISQVGDIDYYTFSISSPGTLEIWVDPVPLGLDIDVYLYNQNQAEILKNEGTPTGERLLSQIQLTPGTYYLKIKDGPGYSNGDAWSNEFYTLTLRLDRDDLYENNETFSTAKDVVPFVIPHQENVGDLVQGKIKSTGDLDYYKFVTTVAGVMEIWVDPVPLGLDIDVFLYNQTQAEILKNEGTPTGERVFSQILLAPGTYYLKIKDGPGYSNGDAWSDGLYTVALKLDTTDEYETNNLFAEAKDIAIGTDVRGKIKPIGDLDYYKFSISSSGTYKFEISVPTGIDADLFVYNQSQAEILKNEGTPTGERLLSQIQLTPGTYYLKIKDGPGYSNGDAWSDSFYTLKVSRQ